MTISLVTVFFLTRLPFHILSIYIDATSHTYLPEDAYLNGTKSEFGDDVVAAYSSYVDKTDKQMFLVLYLNPIFQLLSLSNSAINPLCYCFMSHAVKHILTFFQQKIRRGQKKGSSMTLVRWVDEAILTNQTHACFAEQSRICKWHFDEINDERLSSFLASTRTISHAADFEASNFRHVGRRLKGCVIWIWKLVTVVDFSSRADHAFYWKNHWV